MERIGKIILDIHREALQGNNRGKKGDKEIDSKEKKIDKERIDKEIDSREIHRGMTVGIFFYK